MANSEVDARNGDAQMGSPMKVLLVITGLSMGGAENVVANFADALAQKGFEVLVVYLKEKPFEVAPRNPAVRVVCLGVNSVRDAFAGYARFRRIVRTFKPDIVHSHMFHATMLARLTRLSLRMPGLICTAHNTVDGGRLRTLAYRVTDRLADISTNVSREAVEAFVGRGAVRSGRMLAMHNGIEVDEFKPSSDSREEVRSSFGIAPDCKLFVSAGRLTEQKDYPSLFKALTLLPASLDYTLLIAGDGALRASLERLAGELGLADRVRFLGIRRDVPRLMCAADVFVLSSVWEGFALVVAEAMACECVVVATDCGGVREVLGNDGFLIPSGDPAALAEALLAASSMDKAAARKIGSAARQRVVSLYSFDRTVERWRELYGSILSSKRPLKPHVAS
jgi:glycosyltransferase involved in cell wall biosynthesis